MNKNFSSKTKSAIFILGLLVFSFYSSFIFAFSSGSTGADGALLVDFATHPTFEINLPPSGKLNYTTVTIESGCVVTFKKNALNTPVYMLATGDVVIYGTINIDGSSGTQSPPVGGAGGAGGYDGGMPGILGAAPGAGHGPGGGKGGTNNDPNNNLSAGAGSYGTQPTVPSGDYSTSDGITYGSPLLVPMVGGSGGGGTEGQPGRGGAGGGGAILIASDTSIEIKSTGKITARGGHNSGAPQTGGQGSGGAVRLVAPVVKGMGTLDVQGGFTDQYYGATGGHGRIRIDTLNRNETKFTFSPLEVASMGSFMAVFPEPNPSLDIIHVAGTDIPVGTGNAVQIVLPFGSSTSQTVTVQAKDFPDDIYVEIAVIPENGTKSTYYTPVDMDVNPDTASKTVTIPNNVVTHVFAWTCPTPTPSPTPSPTPTPIP